MSGSKLGRASLLASAGLMVVLGTAQPANAEGQFLVNARLRTELVDQDGLANDATAITLRTRLGYQTGDMSGFTFLVEGENVLHLVDDFNDTINGLPGYPVVADPETTELNRLQLAYTGFEKTSLTLGRQRIILGDARYVGNVGFRQNEQTFDAFLASTTAVEHLTLTYAYLDRVHRVFGDDHPAGEFNLDTHVLTAAFAAPVGVVTAMAILNDVTDAALLSSATYVVKWSGSVTGEGRPTFGYRLEYAVQSDYGNSPTAFDLAMFRAEASLSQNGLSGALGIESLEGNGARGFSTPLATLHGYQGWADVFLTTPADGIRDVYGRAGYAFPNPPFGSAMGATVVFHNFEAENGGADLGSEFDAVLSSQLTEHVGLEFKAALYDGGDSALADRTKLWFAITYSR
ncbi:hypothetical protein [uncultured Maricaulis sp.]|uniref:hypothetical protein n=1 Tax=uncultured Maricaulis sp. TaxID=174710 RepID=UPI0030DCA0EB|tara:strand:+ start:29291 stop:30499 length:1209 start_codon:yes stop_codon:yes gene_type:complete